MKKITSVILMLSLLIILSANCFAYTVGEMSVDINLSDYTKISNAQVDNGTLSFQAGGKAAYDLYVPFNAVKIGFHFTIEGSGNLKMYIGSTEHNIALSSMEKYYTLPDVLRRGEYTVTFVSDVEFKLHRVNIQKEDVAVAPDATGVVPALTDFEKSVQTAVILHDNSPVIMVNGARRYVNNDNVREIPYIVNGEIYLPLHSFARAFGYYYEKTDDTLLLSKENRIYILKNGILTKQENGSTPVNIDNIILSNEWGVFVPITYFAKTEGKTVVKKDGFYIFEFNSNMKNILKEENFSCLKDFYKDLYLEENTGKTYYVCQTCNSNDANDGSKEFPFRTITKAAQMAQAGDTVIIGEGLYYEKLAPINDGTASRPITFKAAEGANVELSTTAVLGNPVDILDNGIVVYEALVDLGDGRNQIFYKRDLLAAGRHPNKHTVEREVPIIENLSPIWPTQGNIKVTLEDSKVAVSDTDLDQEADYWKGGTFVGLTGYGWSLATAKIESSEPGKLNLTDTTKTWWFVAKENNRYKDFGYITDCRNTIDMPGEWAYEDGKIYILPPEGETADTLKIEQKLRQVVIDIADRKHIIIEGINTYGGGMRLNNSEMCMLRDGEYRYISHYTHTMDQREGFIDSRDIYNEYGAPTRGELGIYLGGRDNIVLNNHIAYSAGAGLYMVGLYEYVENNIVSDCGYMGSYLGGIFLGTEGWGKPDDPRGGNAIFENTVYNSGRNCYGSAVTESWILSEADKVLPSFLPDEVAYNDFYNGSICTRDVGTVYLHGAVMGTDRFKSRFHNNVTYDSWSFDSFNCGVYYDNWMQGAECYDNVVFHTDSRIMPRFAFFYQPASDFPGSFATIDNWNNIDAGLVKEGKEALKSENYPDCRKFKSGARALLTDNSPMLSSIAEDNGWYNPAEMTYSGGVTVKDGQLCPSADGDWVCVGNADFSQGQNRISIEFSGDIYNTGDAIEVFVGNSLTSNIASGENKLAVTSAYLWGTNTVSMFFHGIEGQQNVWVRFKDYKSAAIKRIRISKGYDEEANATNVYMAQSCNIEVEKGSAPDNTSIVYLNSEDIHGYVKSTFEGAVLSFKGIKVLEDSDTLRIRTGSKSPYNGQTIEFRLGSPDGELITTYKCEENDWNHFVLRTQPLNRVLEAGTYDIYVKFTSPGSTNFRYFGFSNSTGAQTE